MDSKIQINYTDDQKQTENSITFDIKGEKDKGLNKSIINSLRRVLLSSIPSIGFRTEMNNTDIKILKNTTPLHNEFILHRIAMIPLYLDPKKYKKDYLFKLKVESSSENPLVKVTAKDFEIFTLKKDESPSDDGSIELEKYNDKPISDKEKEKIFRPFLGKHFCEIIELKSTNSSLKEELELYGVPRISYAYEDARWQAVSCATYSFKRSNELFNKVLNEKMKIDNVSKEEEDDYANSLYISESERYYERDNRCEPYWYEFKIDSQHQLNSKELFIQACEILISELENFKEELPQILSKGEDSRFSIEQKKDNIFTLFVHGNDDTIGNILQTYIVNEIIEKKETDFTVCGYKKTHPLEDLIFFNIALNPGIEKSTQRNIVSIIELFNEACTGLIKIYSSIKKSSEKNL